MTTYPAIFVLQVYTSDVKLKYIDASFDTSIVEGKRSLTDNDNLKMLTTTSLVLDCFVYCLILHVRR